MNHAITVELQFFAISILWGAIILLVYDCLRIFRRLIKHDSFFIAVEDLFFWVLASLFIFAMIYKENDGIIRGFSLMGMAIGTVLYHYIISEFLVNFTTKLIQTLFRPFTIAFRKVKRFVLFLLSKGKKAGNFIIRRLKKRMKSVRIALNRRKLITEAKRKKRLEKKAALRKQKDQDKQAKHKQKESKNSKPNKRNKKGTSLNANPNQSGKTVNNPKTGQKATFEKYQRVEPNTNAAEQKDKHLSARTGKK